MTPKQSDYLGVVTRNVVQLRRMISDLMEVTRIGSGKLPLDMGLVDVNACVSEAIEAVATTASAKQIELTVEPCGNAPRIHVDSGRVTQVAVNLLGNAIKHTPVGGRVGVRVTRDGDDFVRVTVHDTAGFQRNISSTCSSASTKCVRTPTRVGMGSGSGSTSRMRSSDCWAVKWAWTARRARAVSSMFAYPSIACVTW